MHIKTIYGNALKGKSNDTAHYQIIANYVYMRLKTLFSTLDIPDDTIDEVCELIYDHYNIHNVSVDQIVNAIINYVNCYDKFPEKSLISKDLDVLLEDFRETYYDVHNEEFLI